MKITVFRGKKRELLSVHPMMPDLRYWKVSSGISYFGIDFTKKRFSGWLI